MHSSLLWRFSLHSSWLKSPLMPTAPQHGYVIDAPEVLASFSFPTVKDKQKGYDLKLSFQLKPKVQIEVKSLIQPGERIARAKDAYTPVQYPEFFFVFFFPKFCWLLASPCSPRLCLLFTWNIRSSAGLLVKADEMFWQKSAESRLYYHSLPFILALCDHTESLFLLPVYYFLFVHIRCVLWFVFVPSIHPGF